MPNFEKAESLGSRATQSSEIRKLLNQKVDISFGGGYPSPESFPIDVIKSIYERIIYSNELPALLQYGPTEGYPPFIKQALAFLQRSPGRQVVAGEENLVVTTGSQQGLKLLGDLFIDPGDYIGVEDRSYLGAIQAFKFYCPNFVIIPIDEQGMIPDALAETIINFNPKFIYTGNTFKNPTGKTTSLERRHELAQTVQYYNYDGYIIDDEPYPELRYEGEHIPSLQSMAPEHVIYLFTFSKTLAPAFRLGGAIAPADVRDKLIILKQGADLCTSSFNQAVAAEYLAGGHLESHLPEVVELYKPRRDTMLQALSEFFPPIFKSTKPQGGMFVWVELDPKYAELAPRFNPELVRDEALEKRIGTVPGPAFFAHPEKALPSWRLNFTNADPNKIRTGIEILGKILYSKMP